MKHKTMLRQFVVLLTVSVLLTTAAVAYTGSPQYDFETGDFSKWSKVESAYSITTNSPGQGTYAAISSGGDAGGAGYDLEHNPPDANYDNMSMLLNIPTDDGQSLRNRVVYLKASSGGTIIDSFEIDDGAEACGVYGSLCFGGEVGVMQPDTWYRINWDFNWTAGTSQITLINTSNGNMVGQSGWVAMANNQQIGNFKLLTRGVGTKLDNVAYNTQPETYSVSGYVKDPDGNAIDAATVEVVETGEADTTASDGSYVFELENGTYTLSASKNGYEDASTTVTVDGSDVTGVNFTLARESDPSIVLDTRTLIRHNKSHPYVVREIVNESGTNTSYTVTDAANVTSLNTTLLTVNETSNELVATGDTNVSGVVQVRAEYNGSISYTNVTVAEPTVENLEIVPGLWRVSAVVGDDFYFFLLIAILMAVPAARYTSAFGGLAVGEMVLVVGWLGGYVSFGMAAVSVFISLFIGLNLAANINYTTGRFDRG